MARGIIYTDEVREAVCRGLSAGRSVAAVSLETGVSPTTIRRWRGKWIAAGASPGGAGDHLPAPATDPAVEKKPSEDDTAENIPPADKSVENQPAADQLTENQPPEEHPSAEENSVGAREQFAADTWAHMVMAEQLIGRKLERALKEEEAIDALLRQVAVGVEDEKDRRALIAKLEQLKVSGMSELTRAMCALYDRQALASGAATEIVDDRVMMRRFEDL